MSRIIFKANSSRKKKHNTCNYNINNNNKTK